MITFWIIAYSRKTLFSQESETVHVNVIKDHAL